MALALTIGGVSRTAWVKIDSCSISRQLNGRSNCSMELEDIFRGYRPVVGNSVILADGATRRFAGSIDSVTERRWPGSNALRYSLRCVDYNQICDRRLVTWKWPADSVVTMKQVVEFIVNTFLDGEGITTTGVATGPNIVDPLDFNYNSAAEVFNKISAITGYGWYIDFNLDLKFSQFTATSAPISLTETSGNWWDIEINQDRGNYRNRQYARTEYQISSTRTDSFVGNGASRTFFTNLAIQEPPTITRAGNPQTVGILGVDPPGTKEWYYIPFSNSVQNFAPNPVLTALETLQVTYIGPYSNVALSQDAAEVAARAVIEGGSGKYEALREERNVTNLSTLEALAAGERIANGSIVKEVQVNTDSQGVEPGQQITITIPIHDLSGSFLIESTEYQWMRAGTGSLDFLRTKIKCSDRAMVVQAPRATQVFERLIEVARIGADPNELNQSSWESLSVVSTTATPDRATGINQIIRLNDPSTTIAAAVGARTGDEMRIYLEQDSTGGREVVWDASYEGAENFPIITEPDTYSVFTFTRTSAGIMRLTLAPVTGVPYT